MTDILHPKEFSASTRRALADFVLAMADTKRMLGVRYAEWCDSAPALEAAVAASAMAQDELGHCRALLPLLKDFPEVDPGIADELPRGQFSSIAFLDSPFSTWPTFVTANILIGGALTVALESARRSRFVPLRTRAVKILEEERFHWLHGEGWFKRLSVDDKQGADLGARVAEILPQALCWFGRAEDLILAQEGILDAPPEQLREQLLDKAGPLIGKSQAEFLLCLRDGHWQYTGEMPWSRFDPITRRLGPVESR